MGAHPSGIGALRVSGQGTLLLPSPPVTLSEQNFSIPYLKTPEAGNAQVLLTEPQKQRFVRRAAHDFLRNLPTVDMDGEEYHILHWDSTAIVWDGRVADITYSRQKLQTFEQGPPLVETILNRPLLDFCVPEGCWRPFDLHPNSLTKLEVGCAVQMIYDSFVLSHKSSGAALRKGFPSRTFTHGATIGEIEADFDLTFDQLGYVDG